MGDNRDLREWALDNGHCTCPLHDEDDPLSVLFVDGECLELLHEVGEGSDG